MAEWVIEQHEDGTCDVQRDRRPATFTYSLDAAKLWLDRDSRSSYRQGDRVDLVSPQGERTRYR